MSNALEDVTRQAVELSRTERLELARLLIDLDQPKPSPKAEAAWDEEIRARLHAVEEGRVEGIPYEQVLARVDRRLGA